MRKLSPGDVLESAIWMDGRETEELKRRFEGDLRDYFAYLADENNVVIGPVVMTEKRPGDDRMPSVPKNIQGPDVRLLVGEASVIAVVPVTESRFVDDLDERDLQRLRAILRRVHKSYGNISELSDEKCDEYININGPDAAVAALREQVGVKVH